MKLSALTSFAVFTIFGLSSWAFEAECDQHHRIEYNDDSERLKLPAGGSGQHTGWEWVALTEFSNGHIEHPDDVEIEWISKTELNLTTQSKLWRDQRRIVTCVVTLSTAKNRF